MRTLVLALACLAAAPAQAVLFYHSQYKWDAPVPALPTDATFFVRTRPNQINANPPIIEEFTVPVATYGHLDLHINQSSASTYGIDWPLWVSGFLTSPNTGFEIFGKRSEFEVYASLNQIDDLRVLIDSTANSSITDITLAITGSGPIIPPPITPEPSAAVLLMLGVACHVTWTRPGNSKRRADGRP